MVFGSFNLHDEFFAKHQLNYLADIVRMLHYTGLKFNFYDVSSWRWTKRSSGNKWRKHVAHPSRP